MLDNYIKLAMYSAVLLLMHLIKNIRTYLLVTAYYWIV